MQQYFRIARNRNKVRARNFRKAPQLSLCGAALSLRLFFDAGDCDREVVKLLVVYDIRAVHHEVGCVLNLREGDDVADGVQTGEQHAQTVKTVSEAAVPMENTSLSMTGVPRNSMT